MKISLKQILAVGAMLGASASAFADISLPGNTSATNGNGELTLIVWDKTTDTSYVRGLGTRLNDIATTAAMQANDPSYTVGSTAFNIPVTINMAADANLTSFLAAAAPTDNIVWAVMGGAIAGNTNVTGVKRYVTTDALAATAMTITNAKITSNFSNLNAWDTAFSGEIQSANGGNTTVGNMQSATMTTTSAGKFTNSMNSWAGGLPTGNLNTVALGSSANFYLLSSSSTSTTNLGAGGSATAARVYQLAGLTLSSNGTLTSDPVGTVTPIPAAIWLLGSGLAGLVGIGRRKQAA